MENQDENVPVPARVKKKSSVGFNPKISVVLMPEPSVNEDDDTISIVNSRVWETGREQWDKSWDFLVSLISLTVGLGNIYRFPYTVYKNGGGAFLIPYLIVFFLIGRPIYFLELAIGQFASQGQVKIWRMAPICKGAGYGSMIATIVAVTYYGGTMAMLLFYFFSSFQSDLPWATCNRRWVSPGDGAGMWRNDTGRHRLYCNESDLTVAFEYETGEPSSISLAQLYLENDVMKQRRNIKGGGMGAPDWRLSLCLLLAWILVWQVILRGIRVSGKVAYVTAIFPFTLLTILFIRAVTLSNAWEGIKYYFIPHWEKMLEINVWFAALSQCLFSLNAGFGSLVMLSSFNRFERNIYKDAWIVTGLDTFTTIFGGVTIFAFLGNLAGELDVDIDKVLVTENDFALIVFAQGVSTFKWVPHLFSLIFFLMLVLLSGGTIVVYVGSIITVITDQFPKVNRLYATTGVCLAGFCAGLLYLTPEGSIMVRLADWFGVKIVLHIMAFVEVIGVAWIYGVDNFIRDVEFMLGIRLGLYWRLTWCYIIPISLTGILIYAIVDGEGTPGYKGEDFSTVTITSGWLFSALAVSALPICSYHAIKSVQGGTLLERIRAAMKPTADWGPLRVDIRQDWLHFKERMP